jgi:serine/threonine protein phosphatase PrpC
MSNDLQKLSFFTPVIASEVNEKERFATIGRFVEKLWDVNGNIKSVKIIQVSELSKNAIVEELPKAKRNCFVTAVKIAALVLFFPVLLAIKLIYRHVNRFYVQIKRENSADLKLVENDAKITNKNKLPQTPPKATADLKPAKKIASPAALVESTSIVSVEENPAKKGADVPIIAPSEILPFINDDAEKNALGSVPANAETKNELNHPSNNQSTIEQRPSNQVELALVDVPTVTEENNEPANPTAGQPETQTLVTDLIEPSEIENPGTEADSVDVQETILTLPGLIADDSILTRVDSAVSEIITPITPRPEKPSVEITESKRYSQEVMKKESEALYQALLSQTKKTPEQLVEEGKELHTSGNHHNAIKVLLKAIHSMPNGNADFVGLRGEAYAYAYGSLERLLKVPTRRALDIDALKKMDVIKLLGMFYSKYFNYIENYEEADPAIIQRKLYKNSFRPLSIRENDLEISKPDLSGIDIHDEVIEAFSVGLTHTIGQRKAMEDRSLVTMITVQQADQPEVNMDLYAVFDGHGDKDRKHGETCAQFCKENFAEILKAQLEKKNSLSDLDLWNALKLAGVELNKSWAAAKKTKAGSTASFAIVFVHPETQEKMVCTGSIGDTRLMISSGSVVKQLATDARIEDTEPHLLDKSFLQSVKNRKGEIKKDAQGTNRLNLMECVRVIGNHEFVDKKTDLQAIGFSARPEVSILKLSDFESDQVRLVIASDGVSDVMGTQKMADEIQGLNPQTAARRLVEQSLIRDSGDNITALVVDIKR